MTPSVPADLKHLQNEKTVTATRFSMVLRSLRGTGMDGLEVHFCGAARTREDSTVYNSTRISGLILFARNLYVNKYCAQYCIMKSTGVNQ